MKKIKGWKIGPKKLLILRRPDKETMVTIWQEISAKHKEEIILPSRWSNTGKNWFGTVISKGYLLKGGAKVQESQETAKEAGRPNPSWERMAQMRPQPKKESCHQLPKQRAKTRLPGHRSLVLSHRMRHNTIRAHQRPEKQGLKKHRDNVLISADCQLLCPTSVSSMFYSL